MPTLLDEPETQPHANVAPAERLRTTMAAMRLSFTWFGTRKTLTTEQKAQAAGSFGAEADCLSAGKKLLDTRHENYKAVTAVRGRAVRDSLRAPPPSPFASPAEIFADLLAIDQEFDEFAWNGKDHTIAVSTPPIAFDDVPLGRFWIELRWQSLRPLRLGCYHVVAREPNPAGTDESVTHPHVQDEFLCEGEAQGSIHRALSQGRLLDFFVLVRCVLDTYNSASPYVPIEDWGGIRCGDCDVPVPRDEISRCCACSTRLCGECCSLCSGCDDEYCSECISRCAACDERCCSACLSACTHCGKSICNDCLQSNGRCENCDDEVQSETGQPDAAVQPDRVGQAPVPA
jgi:hypothetical protein